MGTSKSSSLVSIVLNNYNYERFLARAINSALAQTYMNCEVLVVDDGSTDNSRSIIEKYSNKVRAIFKENGGQASAFNVGIEAAVGDYILLLDSDDVLVSDAVKVCLDSIDTKKVVRLAFGLDVIDAEGNNIGPYQNAPRKEFQGPLYDYILEYNQFLGTPTSGNLFRAAELKQCLHIPESSFRISADLYLFFKIAQLGEVQCIPDVLAQYRIHGANNYTQKGSRIYLTPKQRLNNCKNICQSIVLMDELLDRVTNNRKSCGCLSKNIFINTHNIEILSDGIRSGFVNDGCLEVSQRWLLANSFKLMFEPNKNSVFRKLFGFLTVSINALLPASFSERVIKLLYKFKLA